MTYREFAAFVASGEGSLGVERPDARENDMKSSKICLHNIDPRVAEDLSEYRVEGTTTGRDDLRTLIGMGEIAALVIDLDTADALDAVVEVLEIDPQVAVIGVTGSDDVQRVITAQRAGCSQLARKPLSEHDLGTALRRALGDASAPSHDGMTIAVMGSTGGAGATTLACYLAMSLADRSPLGACAIDLDLEFGNLSHMWDIKPRHTLADLAAARTIDKLLVEDMVVELPCRVGVLARPSDIAQAHTVEEGHIASTISATRALCSHVVIDMPRKLDAIAGCVIESCDKLVVVSQLNFAGVHNAERLAGAFDSYGLDPDKIEFVVNRFRKQSRGFTIDMLESRVSKKVLGAVPNHYKTLSTATNAGRPVPQKNAVRKAVELIAAKLCEKSPARLRGQPA